MITRKFTRRRFLRSLAGFYSGRRCSVCTNVASGRIARRGFLGPLGAQSE